MASVMISLTDFDELRRYVKSVLCQKADLNDDTPMLESDIQRRGQPCGIEYLLLGPRSLRLSSIWAPNEKRILFYDEHLNRFQVTPVDGPDPAGIPHRNRETVALKSVWKGK